MSCRAPRQPILRPGWSARPRRGRRIGRRRARSLQSRSANPARARPCTTRATGHRARRCGRPGRSPRSRARRSEHAAGRLPSTSPRAHPVLAVKARLPGRSRRELRAVEQQARQAVGKVDVYLDHGQPSTDTRLRLVMSPPNPPADTRMRPTGPAHRSGMSRIAVPDMRKYVSLTG